ncbi:MAG: rhomboid family intramembrane serine protease [Lachnospiraceae bacterium]|nr:rhomboid family intramembrane serine protease [Lachnospiraceae bacterium]
MANHENRSEKVKDPAEIKKWAGRNITAVGLVLLFILIYIASAGMEDAYLTFGATGMSYLNREYYRFITCLFLHYNPRHLLGNSLALLAVSSLLTPFSGKGKTLFLFLSGGILAEFAYAVVTFDPVYDIGASSGVFALIACLLVCYLRFPEQFHPKWYRPDVVIVVVYFVFANSSVTAFLVHAFGFIAGTLISSVMILTGAIKKPGF